MNKLDRVLIAYESFVSLPWKKDLSKIERVWFLLYDKMDERRIRIRLSDFEISTKKAAHGWVLCDLTDAFAAWMSKVRYKESYFEDPDSLNLENAGFAQYAADQVGACILKEKADANTVVAVYGVGSLFGLVKVSDLAEKVAEFVPGRLVVFFPGEYENNNYRLLGAKDGWNYLAIPITADTGVQEG